MLRSGRPSPSKSHANRLLAADTGPIDATGWNVPSPFPERMPMPPEYTTARSRLPSALKSADANRLGAPADACATGMANVRPPCPRATENTFCEPMLHATSGTPSPLNSPANNNPVGTMAAGLNSVRSKLPSARPHRKTTAQCCSVSNSAIQHPEPAMSLRPSPSKSPTDVTDMLGSDPAAL